MRTAIAYGVSGFSSSLFNNLFFLYYVDVFMRGYGLSAWWFGVGQVVFAIWNAINDPLAGLFSPERHRLRIIGIGGPIMALSFLVAWFPWSMEGGVVAGLHFIVATIAYDGMFTLVVLNHCALLADISGSQRPGCLFSNSVAQVIAAIPLLLSSQLFDLKNIGPFQWFCIGCAVLGALGYIYTSTTLSAYPHQPAKPHHSTPNPLKFARDIFKNKNFVVFILVNFLQVLSCTANTNFFPLFASVIISSQTSISYLTTLSFFVPGIAVAILSRLLHQHTLDHVVKYLLYLKVASVLFAACIAMVFRNYMPILAFFLVFNRSLADTTMGMFNLVLAEICDEDMMLHKRIESGSSLVYGYNALVTKPAQSVAPVLFWYFLSGHFSDADSVATPQGVTIVMQLLLLVPFVTGVAQIGLWKLYKLRIRVDKDKSEDLAV